VTFRAFHDPFSFFALVAKEYQFIKKESNIKKGWIDESGLSIKKVGSTDTRLQLAGFIIY